MCRNYLSPKQIGFVHQLYTTNESRIQLTNANKFVDTAAIKIWGEVHWDKPMVVRQDIVVKRGQTLVINQPLHMAANAGIYVEAKAKLVVNGRIYNCFGDEWEGIILCKSYLKRHKMPCKKKNYGLVILDETGSVKNAKLTTP